MSLIRAHLFLLGDEGEAANARKGHQDIQSQGCYDDPLWS